jgi:hypothetical protein
MLGLEISNQKYLLIFLGMFDWIFIFGHLQRRLGDILAVRLSLIHESRELLLSLVPIL